MARIWVETFHEARRLAAIPATTEEAQYSLPGPVAAALATGSVDVEAISAPGLRDPEIRRSWPGSGPVDGSYQETSTVIIRRPIVVPARSPAITGHRAGGGEASDPRPTAGGGDASRRRSPPMRTYTDR